MNDQHDNDEDGAMPTMDELVATLTGRCLHEVQLGRVMGLLGLAAAQAGGKMVLRLEGLKALDGHGIGIAIDEVAGTATVELLTAPEGEAKSPTHPASTLRHLPEIFICPTVIQNAMLAKQL